MWAVPRSRSCQEVPGSLTFYLYFACSLVRSKQAAQVCQQQAQAVHLYLRERTRTSSCRYMRATQLRWPLRLLSRGRAVDLVNLELKAALVNGGYAVVTVDVRGTGGLQRGQRRSFLAALPGTR